MQYIHDKEAFLKYLYQQCHCANAGQSQEERRLKYAIARSMGKGWIESAKLRDWNRNPFAKKFGYSSWDIMLNIITKGE